MSSLTCASIPLGGFDVTCGDNKIYLRLLQRFYSSFGKHAIEIVNPTVRRRLLSDDANALRLDLAVLDRDTVAGERLARCRISEISGHDMRG